MHENRTKYPKKKAQMYQLLQDLPKKYSVTALVRMEKVRASQLLPLRKKLGEENMDDADLAANANAVATTIEKTLPNGNKNIKKIMFKTTMGKAIRVKQVKK